MEIEYSDFLCEYYCSPDCATDRYYDYMGSTVLYNTELKEHNLKVLNNGQIIRLFDEPFMEG